MKSKTKCRELSIKQKCVDSYHQLSVPQVERYILRLGGWLNKSSDTEWKVFSPERAALHVPFRCQIRLPWCWWACEGPVGVYSISGWRYRAWEAGRVSDRETWWEITSESAVMWQNSVGLEPAHQGARFGPPNWGIWAFYLAHWWQTEGGPSWIPQSLDWLFCALWRCYFKSISESNCLMSSSPCILINFNNKFVYFNGVSSPIWRSSIKEKMTLTPLRWDLEQWLKWPYLKIISSKTIGTPCA